MGPWASAIVAVAALTAVVIAVLAFRGLIEAIDGVTNRCADCGHLSLWPLPAHRHECWQCRHSSAAASLHVGRIIHR